MNRWGMNSVNQEGILGSGGGQSRFSDMDWGSGNANLQGARGNSYGYDNEPSGGMNRGGNDMYSMGDGRSDMNMSRNRFSSGVDDRRKEDNYRMDKRGMDSMGMNTMRDDDYATRRNYGGGMNDAYDLEQDRRINNRDERYVPGMNDRADRRKGSRFDAGDERDDRMGYKQNSGLTNRNERGRFNDDMVDVNMGRNTLNDRNRRMDDGVGMSVGRGLNDSNRVRGLDGMARKRGMDSLGMNTMRDDDNMYRNQGMDSMNRGMDSMNRGMDNMNMDRGIDSQNMSRGLDNMNMNRGTGMDNMNMNRAMGNMNRGMDNMNRGMGGGLLDRRGDMSKNDMNMNSQMRGGMAHQNFNDANIRNVNLDSHRFDSSMSGLNSRGNMNEQRMMSDDRGMMSGGGYASEAKRPRMTQFDRNRQSGMSAGNKPVRGGYAGSSSNLTRKQGRDLIGSKSGPSATTQAGKFILKRTLQSGGGYKTSGASQSRTDNRALFSCSVCDIKMSTLKIYQRHLEGKYHKEKLRMGKKPESKPASKPASKPVSKPKSAEKPKPTAERKEQRPAPVKKPEPVKEEKVERNPNAKGREYVVAVTGFFCKLCRKFFNSEGTAKETHCAAAEHIERYEKKEALKKASDQVEAPKVMAKKELPKKEEPKKFLDKLKEPPQKVAIKKDPPKKETPRKEEPKKTTPSKSVSTKPAPVKKPTPKPSPVLKKETPTKPIIKSEKPKSSADLSADLLIIDDIDSDGPIVINGAICDIDF